MPRSKPTPLSEHAQRLAEEQARIEREMAEAERALRERRRPQRTKAAEPQRRVRLNNVAALELPRPRDHRFIGGSTSPRSRRPKRRAKPDARFAQIKFLFLCLILAVLVLILWRNLPPL